MSKRKQVPPRAGGVVVNPNGLIAISGENEMWGLPKGGVDTGESLEQAARREVYEEVGLTDLQVVRKLGQYQRFPHGVSGDSLNVPLLTIHIFLFRTSYTGELTSQQVPANDARWVKPEDVAELLSNPVDREFWQDVLGDIISFVRNSNG